jgi:2-(1,2-epoxy-1,2-dihydrophenyl)acetyl-CoA isomerase
MPHIETTQIDKITVIRMCLENRMNSLEKELRDELKQCLQQFSTNKDSHVAVLTGVGKAFCAGGSLKELEGGMRDIAAVDYMKEVSELIVAITTLEKPVIAAVNGAAVGAGFSLALACDIVIASHDANFSQTFAKVGLIPDMGGLYFLPRIVGLHKAKELIFTAKMLTAAEAFDLGLVNHLVPSAELEASTLKLAEEISGGSMKAIALSKSILSKSLQLSLADVLEYEALAQAICMQSDDHREGIRAFYEKRFPDFSGK